MSYLVLKDNRRMFWPLPSPPAPFSIGRVADNDLAILDPQVSRKHARSEPDGAAGWSLLDLDSANGTFVNGEAVAKVSLKTGDEIRFGKTVFVLEPDAPETDEDTD